MPKTRSCSILCLALCSFLLALVWTPALAESAGGSGTITIFHTNDMHARILPEDDRGASIGLPEIATVVKEAREASPNVLWLDAGDTVHGMPMINVSKGENMVPLLNAAGVDALSPGNHDFNYGSKQLEKLAKAMKFPVLCANLVRKDNGKNVFPSYKIYKLQGIKVGVFGLSTPECAFKTSPKNVETVEFLNPVDKSREMVKKLRPQCDVVVALMHMGLDESSEFTSERIAREVPGIDLIVDGHSHTTLPEGLQAGNTLIVQTGWHEYNLGKVEIKLENHRITSKKAQLLGDELFETAKIQPDPVVQKGLDKVKADSEVLFSEVVAHTDRALSGDRLLVRRQEAELGNLCADAIRWKTGAEVAVINGGGMRTDLPKGDVTRGACLAIFPFGNTVQLAEVQGKTIRQMMEHSVYGYPASFGGFLDFSGMTVSCDPTRPVGQRITEIKVNGVPLDDNRIYTLATNDFIFAGGDDYEMLKGSKIIGESDTCEEVLASYLNEVGMEGIETGRLKMVKEVELPDEAADGAEMPKAA